MLARLGVGQTIGITTATWLAVRTGIGRLSDGTTWPSLVGVAILAGIGVTVSLFTAGLAFPTDSPFEDAAKIGGLAASVLAASIGAITLVRVRTDPDDR